MADIFISYKRENQDAVQRIVQGLRANGLSVWWDQDIPADAPWEETIERELAAAKVVIVCWSEAAVASENVKAEARRARTQGKLIQTYVQPCEPPLFFGERQGVDLSSWNGNANDNRFQAVLTAARAILAGKKPPAGVGYRPKKRTPWGAVAAVISAASLVLGFISDAGGAKTAFCELGTFHNFCVENGWIVEPVPPPNPEEVAAAARQALLQSVAGTWGRLDRACADKVTFAIETEGDAYRIRSTADGGFNSVMQVTTIDPDGRVITAREIDPGEDGRREQWEYRPNDAVLAMRDAAGTETTLGRCES